MRKTYAKPVAEPIDLKPFSFVCTSDPDSRTYELGDGQEKGVKEDDSDSGGPKAGELNLWENWE